MDAPLSTRSNTVRMALGTKPRDVLGLVVGQAARLTGLGLVIGVAGAFLISRTLASFLFGVPPTDITVFAAVAVVLTAVALVSSYLPAIRAMRIDAAGLLRSD